MLDHDLVVWFGDFHSSIGGLEPVSFGSSWQGLRGLGIYLMSKLKAVCCVTRQAELQHEVAGLRLAVRDEKAEVELEEAEDVARWQRLVQADTLTAVRAQADTMREICLFMITL